MPKTPPGHVWLRADVPKPIAAQFAEYARTQHRSARQQVRALIEQHAREHAQRDDGERQAA
jgi:hypothetical protein